MVLFSVSFAAKDLEKRIPATSLHRFLGMTSSGLRRIFQASLWGRRSLLCHSEERSDEESFPSSKIRSFASLRMTGQEILRMTGQEILGMTGQEVLRMTGKEMHLPHHKAFIPSFYPDK